MENREDVTRLTPIHPLTPHRLRPKEAAARTPLIGLTIARSAGWLRESPPAARGTAIEQERTVFGQTAELFPWRRPSICKTDKEASFSNGRHN